MRCFITATILAATATATPLGAQDTGQPARDPGVVPTSQVTAALAAWQLPRVAVAVVRNDSIVYERGFGVREAGKATPVTPHTVFAIGPPPRRSRRPR